MSQESLFGLSERFQEVRAANRVLRELNEHIDWEAFRGPLRKMEKADRKSPAGRPSYDSLLKFKMLILQELYNLSDDQLEFQVRDRLSFMSFLGLSVSSKVPDAKTLWAFRERLRELNLLKTLFSLFHRMLSERGIETKSGVLVDASIIEVPKSRNKREENEELKRGETPASFSHPPKSSQKDTDAKWTKKNGKSYFGYKNHISVDDETKVIEDYEVTAAQVHDSQVIESLLQADGQGREVYADSAYRSEAIEQQLAKANYKSQVHERPYRNKPLNEEQKEPSKIQA